MDIKELRRYNPLAGVLQTVSATAIVVLVNGFGLSVTLNYMAGPLGTPKHQHVVFGDVSVALLIATFFARCALAHLATSGPG